MSDNKLNVQSILNSKKTNNENYPSVFNSMESGDWEKSNNYYYGGYSRWDNFETDSFSQSKIFHDGIIKTIDAETMRKWMANPEDNLENIQKLTTFYYITNPNIFQLYDLSVSLPSLSYKILGNTEDNKYKAHTDKIKTILKKVKHKQLTRELIAETAATGTICGVWLGTKVNPYFYMFDSLDFIFPAKRKNGEWVIWVDLSWFDTMTEEERQAKFQELSPIIEEEDYSKFKKDPTKVRYVVLPQEKSVCIRTHTLYRNQRFGIPWSTQSFFDTLHKQKLKDLEKSISNKVINSVAVLSVGSDTNADYAYNKIKSKKKQVYQGVKSGLEKNTVTSGITVLGIPHWSKLEFPEVSTDALDPDKFESIDKDVNSSTSGVSNIINGASNYSAGNLSVDIIYSKIAVLLEQIEDEVYQKLINWVLSNGYKNEYSLEYSKKRPLTTKEKVSTLEKLTTNFGMSVKAIIDELDGVDFDDYIADTLYEQEVLDLPNRLSPYKSSATQSGDDDSTSESDTSTGDNSSTESTLTNDGNNVPKSTD